MKTIVAATDFSDNSINAANYAADLACIVSTDLSLIHVCPIPLSFSEVPAPLSIIERIVTDAKIRMQKLEEDILYRVRERIKISIEVRQGDFISEINSYCAILNPYAVVIGSESTNTFERLLIDGSALSAVKNMSWPLIIVPQQVKFENIRKIGLACDFKKVIHTIPIKEINSLVNDFQAELHVLHVYTENESSNDPATVEESGWLQEILDKFNPKYHFIYSDDIEKSINEFAETHNLDLLIIIPKKHNLMSKVFQHSHSKRFVLHTHIPIMAVHE